MSILLPTKQVWTRQPQQIVGIDWANPFSKGLVSVFNIPLSADCVSGKILSPLSANTKISTEKGICLNAGALIDNRKPRIDGYPLSFSVLCKYAVNTAGQLVIGIGNHGGENTIRIYNGTTGSIQCQTRNTSSGGTSGYVSLNLLTTGWMYVTAVINDPAVSSSYIYVNDLPGGSWTAQTLSAQGFSTFDCTVLRCDPLNWSASTAGLQIAFGAFWANRAFSQDEHRAMYRNPWQIFARRDLRVFAPSVVAGLPTLSLPTYVPGSITSVGFRPQVTAS